MSRIENDHTQQIDALDDPAVDAPERFESSSEAEDSAAHIAELVRRTSERHAAPGPSSVPPRPATPPPAASPAVTPSSEAASPVSSPTTASPPVAPPSVASPPVAPQSAAPDATQVLQAHVPAAAPSAAPATAPDATQVQQAYVPAAAPANAPTPPPYAKPSRRRLRQHTRQTLVAAGAGLVLLIGGAVALSQTFGSDTKPPPVSAPRAAAPAGYAVQVTDVITDCAENSHGRTTKSFETQNCVKATRTLATGQVGGRKVMFVVSRIEMPSADAAAGIKQVLDGDGTGNLDDLIREGKTFAGAPKRMPSSGYASIQAGKVLTVSEAGFIDGGRSASSDPSLRSAASAVAGYVSGGS